MIPEHAVQALQYMKPPKKVDLSNVVISPMPGAIKAVNVKVRERVTVGVVFGCDTVERD